MGQRQHRWRRHQDEQGRKGELEHDGLRQTNPKAEHRTYVIRSRVYKVDRPITCLRQQIKNRGDRR